MAIRKEKQVRFLKQRADLVIKSGGSLTIKKDGTTLEDVEIIELGENLTLTENPDGSITLNSGSLSIDEYPVSGFNQYIEHNKDRYLFSHQFVQNTDGSQLVVGCSNIDQSGNLSKNTCLITSTSVMNGVITIL